MNKPRNIISFCCVLVVVCFFSIILVNNKANNNVNEVIGRTISKNPIILIDPGHGGMDGGASSAGGTMEKHINLQISKYLKAELEQVGYKVLLTREEDIGLYDDSGTTRQKKIQDLNRRCQLKRETACNMFVSIHLNKFPESKYKGAQIWYSNFEESKNLAQILQSGLKTDIDPNNNRKIKAAGSQYKVLSNNDYMPGVIVECGFLSNPEEEGLLKTEQYQKKIAKSLAKSIKNYYDIDSIDKE